MHAAKFGRNPSGCLQFQDPAFAMNPFPTRASSQRERISIRKANSFQIPVSATPEISRKQVGFSNAEQTANGSVSVRLKFSAQIYRHAGCLLMTVMFSCKALIPTETARRKP
jgi:hypothetical protein